MYFSRRRGIFFFSQIFVLVFKKFSLTFLPHSFAQSTTRINKQVLDDNEYGLMSWRSQGRISENQGQQEENRQSNRPPHITTHFLHYYHLVNRTRSLNPARRASPTLFNPAGPGAKAADIAVLLAVA
jgi:hypothetical protein